MKIELLRTVGQLFTFRADNVDKIGYREIDLSSSAGALDRYKMKDTGDGEFSISTRSPAVEAVIELKVGENEYVFTSRDTVEKKEGKIPERGSVTIEVKLTGNTLRFITASEKRIDGSHLSLRHGNMTISFFGDISTERYILGSAHSKNEILNMLRPDRYLAAALVRGIF